MMSKFVNTWHSTYPFCNSTLETIALFQLTPIGINGMLSIEEVAMLQQL